MLNLDIGFCNYTPTNSWWVDVQSSGQFEVGPAQSIHVDLHSHIHGRINTTHLLIEYSLKAHLQNVAEIQQ